MRLTLLVVLLSISTAASGETRWYAVETNYQWQMFTTQDDTDFGEGEEVLERPVPIAGRDPLTMRLLMRVDDAGLPGRKARVTCWFEHIGYEDDLRSWTLSGFEDPEVLRQRARGFLAQPRRLAGIPGTLAYEEEAVGLLLSLAHGRPLLIDLDVPPDMPDPLIYQADAILASVVSDAPAEPIAERHGVAWLESDAAVRDLRDRVLRSDIRRVERLRQLLWHHLKSVAFFVENHQWQFFNPAGLTGDAPVIRTFDGTDLGAAPARPAELSSTTPAFGFPSLYRWASVSDDDLVAAVSQSAWTRGRAGNADAGALTPDDPKTRGYATRLLATRESLADPALDLGSAGRDDLERRLDRRAELGRRYLDTLVSVHQHFRRTGNAAAVADADPGQSWSVRFPMDRPRVVNNEAGEEVDRDPGGEFGLWFAALENVRYRVDDRNQVADRFRIARRRLVVKGEGNDIPVFIPPLLSDGSTGRLGVVSLESTSTLAGERIRPERAKELLKQWQERE